MQTADGKKSFDDGLNTVDVFRWWFEKAGAWLVPLLILQHAAPS